MTESQNPRAQDNIAVVGGSCLDPKKILIHC